MRTDSVLFFFDIFFSSTIVTSTTNFVARRNKKLKFFGFLAGSCLLLLIHIIFYFSTKEMNYFQILEIPRVFDQTKLKKNYRLIQKSKKYLNDPIIKLDKVYQILNTQALKNSYDKFKKTDFAKNEEMISFIQHFHLISSQKLMESLVYYLILIVIVSLTSDDNNSQFAMKWLVATMTGFYFIELNYIFLDNNEEDFIDFFLPNFALFERIALIRELLMPILFIIKFKYQLFYRDPLWEVVKKIKKTAIIQKVVKNSVVSSDILDSELNFALVEGEKNLEAGLEELNVRFVEKMRKERKKKEEEKEKEGMKNDPKVIKEEIKKRKGKVN